MVESQGQTTHLDSKCDWDTTPLECVDEPASGRAGPPAKSWLFADRKGERFATSKNPDRRAWEQSVYYEEGEWKGTPKYQTVHGIHLVAKLCPFEQPRKDNNIAPSKISLRRRMKFYFITPTNPTTCHCPDESVRAVPRPPGIGVHIRPNTTSEMP